MSSISGYRSPVDIGLGQTPLTTEPGLFEEMTRVYNAIHLLNQYLDQLRVVAEGGGGSGQTPADSMPFNRFFVSTALQPIELGDLVSPTTISGQDGIILGALPNETGTTAPTANFAGVALTAAAVGTDVRVGVGPAILSMPGATSGSLIWAYAQRATNGNAFKDGGFYLGNPGPKTTADGVAYAMPVASCVVDGFILFGQYLAR